MMVIMISSPRRLNCGQRAGRAEQGNFHHHIFFGIERPLQRRYGVAGEFGGNSHGAGLGTRLRPLTLHTPKPIVPIFNRPFLHYQIDLLKQVPEIDEIILSLNYQPRRIEDVFGEDDKVALRLRWLARETGYQQYGIVILRVDDDGRIAERWSAYMSM